MKSSVHIVRSRRRQPWAPVFMVAAVLCVAEAHAQPADTSRREPADISHRDTLRLHKGAAVHVEAPGVLPRVARQTQPLAVISRADIRGANAADLSDAVALAPGVFVKQYGGLGGLRTVSLRGTGAQQSVVLIDGVRYRSDVRDAFDFGNIPAEALERVEVTRGGNAVLFGSNALGGAVNVVTRRAIGEPFAARVHAGVGSFGERRAGLWLDGESGGHAWSFGGVLTHADGDYPFTFDEFGASQQLRRENGDFDNLFARGAWSYHGVGRLSAFVQAFDTERGVPGAVVQGNREQLRARLAEQDLFAAMQAVHPVGDWTIALTLSGRANRLRYVDPDARIGGPEGIDNRYIGHDAQFGARASTLIGDYCSLEFSSEIDYASLEGDNLDPAVGSFVDRGGAGIAAASQWYFADGAFGAETAVDAGLRADFRSGLAPALSPAAGISWRLWSMPVRLRARFALSFRSPGFTEQYYLNYGNRDLRAERGTTYDAGATCELGSYAVLEASAFVLDVRDQIVTVPRSPVSWSAANVERVFTRGAEFAIAGRTPNGVFGLRASYTRLRAEYGGGTTEGRSLVYTPEEIFSGIADVRADSLTFGLTWQYTSHRFTLSSNEYASMLPRYVLMGANAGWRGALFGLAVEARAECLNLFDVAYQVVRNYPMPGRAFRLSISARYR